MPLLHPDRLYPTYPAPLWALSWICVIKATIWLCAKTSIASGAFLGKYIIFSMGWFALAYLMGNKRRAGFYLLLVLCFADIIFSIAYPDSMAAFRMANNGYQFSMSSPELLLSSWIGSTALLLMSPLVHISTRPSRTPT